MQQSRRKVKRAAKRKKYRVAKRVKKHSKGHMDLELQEPFMTPEGDLLRVITGAVFNGVRRDLYVRCWKRALMTGHANRKAGIETANKETILANYEANKPLIEESIRKQPPLKIGKWPDIPAVICGGGPSLAKNVHHLQYLEKDAAKVIAINSALPLVPKADLFVVGDWLGDPSWVRGVDVERVDALFSFEAPLFITGLPWKSRTFFNMAARHEHYDMVAREFPKLIQLDLGQHGAFSAFQYVYWQLADPICFAGMDYSWTKGKIHALDHDHQRKPKGERTTPVKDINGDMVDVSGPFGVMCMHMRAAAEFVRRSGVMVYNATEAGILQMDGIIIQRKLKGFVHECNRIKSMGNGQCGMRNDIYHS